MVDVIAYRESGIEVVDLDTDAHDEYEEQLEDGVAEIVAFRTPSQMSIVVDDVDDATISVTGQYFVAVSLTDDDPDEMTQQMLGVEEVDEAVVFASTDEGTNIATIHHLDGGDIEDAISMFEAESMPDTGVTTDVGAPDVDDFGDDEDESDSEETETAEGGSA